jgi:TRAP-type C4-dicarboxylate transport system permease small subunit
MTDNKIGPGGCILIIALTIVFWVLGTALVTLLWNYIARSTGLPQASFWVVAATLFLIGVVARAARGGK